MKYLKSFFLSIMLLVIISSPYDVNAEYSRNDSNVASTVISDYMSRYGEDLFQWDQNAWYELGNELGSVKGIYQTKDEVIWGFACQVYAYPEHSKCTPAERAAAIEYARCLLQEYENITPLKSTAVFILDSLDEDGNYVSLMTIHSAKGLEFKVVFVIGLVEGVLPLSRAIYSLDDNELEEERRLMYVATTRAKEELFLSRPSSKFNFESKRTEGTSPSRFLKNSRKICIFLG